MSIQCIFFYPLFWVGFVLCRIFFHFLPPILFFLTVGFLLCLWPPITRVWVSFQDKEKLETDSLDSDAADIAFFLFLFRRNKIIKNFALILSIKLPFLIVFDVHFLCICEGFEQDWP